MVIYCQDCGATNDQERMTCHVCGRLTQSRPSAVRCSTCEAFVGVDAAFCAACGASCRKETGSAVGASPREEMLAPAFAAARSGDALGIVDAPTTPSPADNAATTTGAPSLPPIPDGGLAKTMPDWLRPTTALDPLQPAPAPVRTQLPPPDDPDLSDTTSFISENDLPDWLRQIATQHAARTDSIAAAAAARDDLASDPSRIESAPDAPAGRIAQLVGDSTPPLPAGGPSGNWLARKETPPTASEHDDPGTVRRSTFSDFVSQRAPGQDAPLPAGPPAEALRASEVETAELPIIPASVPVRSNAPPAPSGLSRIRLVSIAAIVVALVLLAYLFLSGGLG